MENMNYNKLENIGLILVLIALIIMIIISSISAAPNWPLDKTGTCNLFNYTGVDCDKYWCENFMQGNWTSDGLCFKNVTITINDTIIVNSTINDSNVTYYVNLNTNTTNSTLNITNETILTNQTFNNISIEECKK
jgi:hypothetical protein